MELGFGFDLIELPRYLDRPRALNKVLRNRLTAVNKGTHRTEFGYDGLDRRMRIVEKENGNAQSRGSPDLASRAHASKIIETHCGTALRKNSHAKPPRRKEERNESPKFTNLGKTGGLARIFLFRTFASLRLCVRII